MKRDRKIDSRNGDRDTLRPEYDFRGAVRGLTASRFAEGANVVVIAEDLRDVFPDGKTVDEALRALAPLLRVSLQGGGRRKAQRTRNDGRARRPRRPVVRR